MSEEKSRHATDQDVNRAYALAVEQVVVELLQIAGATDAPGDDIMKNLKDIGGNITRHVVNMWEHEIIILTKANEITHVAQVIVKDDEVIHIINTKEEFEKGLKENGSKES